MTRRLPGPGTVAVWLFATVQPDSVATELARLLDTEELRRAESILSREQQVEFVVAHGVVRLLLADLLGVPAGSLRWSFGRHGKPELAHPETELRCNLSHSGGLAALAVTAGPAVGIDIQQWRSDVDLVRMAARYYAPDEADYVRAAGNGGQQAARFTGLWCRKEACVKVTGSRLVPSLRLPAGRPGASTGCVQVNDPRKLIGSCTVRDLPAPAGYSAAVAVAGDLEFELVQHWWKPTTDLGDWHDPERMAVATC
ncbi:MAG TPA: 4'-phosphopantetheinyl transferase superfamily protein [Jatrophihabitans sp.]|jgi:4'-phosphopantetheinyl transferase|nr:4'-phosphopantetheinyl transferase superfamily protein [Jatrophihabitans sp.]